jgi:hypothetical protein
MYMAVSQGLLWYLFEQINSKEEWPSDVATYFMVDL